VAEPSLRLPISGVFTGATQSAVAAYQKANGITHPGIVAGSTWAAIAAGKR
jgi:peptidoglycan hydrolase-like protein with peptidoglycan-binding domain